MSDSTLDAPNSRLVAYFVAEFMLRTALPVMSAFDEDYETALIFMAITAQNVEPLMQNPTSRRQYASFAKPAPAHMVRPVTRMALARATGLPRETVRRKVLKLIAKGYAEETALGLIVPHAVRDLPLYAKSVASQELNLRRLFSMVGDTLAADPVVAPAL